MNIYQPAGSDRFSIKVTDLKTGTCRIRSNVFSEEDNKIEMIEEIRKEVGKEYDMSYNIDTWITKELQDFRIPLTELVKDRDGEPFELEQKWGEPLVVHRMGEMSELRGKIEGDWFYVHEVSSYGEGSGNVVRDVWEEIFKHSEGILIASLVWEGGDSINQIRVENGNITWKDIEI